MDSNVVARKMLYYTIGGKIPVGKTKRRWIEAVEEEPKKILGIRNWKREAMDRQLRSGCMQEAKA